MGFLEYASLKLSQLRCGQWFEGMTGNNEEEQATNQLPEGAGGEEADLHTLVPDNLFRQAERPGRLRDALEARAAALNFSVESVFHRLLANCFIRREHAPPWRQTQHTIVQHYMELDMLPMISNDCWLIKRNITAACMAQC